MKLYMVLLGATPPGRHIEQHDIFFGIAGSIAELVPQMLAFWPEANGKIHIDAYREVKRVGNFEVLVCDAKEAKIEPHSLFFLNLGGYKSGEFDELHYKMLSVATNKADAIKEAKQTAFYLHTGIKGAESHIDDKWGVDVDDIHDINDILSNADKEKYRLQFNLNDELPQDQLVLGYFPLKKIAG